MFQSFLAKFAITLAGHLVSALIPFIKKEIGQILARRDVEKLRAHREKLNNISKKLAKGPPDDAEAKKMASDIAHLVGKL